jgi:hypothetical protein
MDLTDEQEKGARLASAGLSSTDIAKVLGINRRTVNRWKKRKAFNVLITNLRSKRVVRSYDIREAIHYEACRVIYLWMTNNSKAIGKRITITDIREAMKIADQFNPCPKWELTGDPRDKRILGGKIKESDFEPLPLEEINKLEKQNKDLKDLSQREQILKKSDKAWRWLIETSMRLLHLTNSQEAAKSALKDHYEISESLTLLVVNEASTRLGTITKDELNGLFGARVDDATMERHNIKEAMKAAIKENPASVLNSLTKLQAQSHTGGEVVDPVALLLDQIPDRTPLERQFYKKAGCWPEEHDDPSSVQLEDVN